jgi:hypothetical protein
VITLCTHPDRCMGMEDAHADLSAQLAAALTQLGQARAQLTQAQAAVTEWQDAYNGAIEGKQFYYEQFCDKCKEATR